MKRFLVLEKKETTSKSGIKGKTYYKSELAIVEVIKADGFPTDVCDRYLSEGRNVSIVEIPKKGKCHIVLNSNEIIR